LIYVLFGWELMQRRQKTALAVDRWRWIWFKTRPEKLLQAVAFFKNPGPHRPGLQPRGPGLWRPIIHEPAGML
jgi:hypothetical protein